ncbi:MAG: hypothetical protein QOI63_1663 [Thermoplasmata archaeon]|jgi:hypothetical protein|nr:hypothetical protein [Thermoplasmata archaeon]
MSVRGELRIDVGSATEARLLAAALTADDAELAPCRAEGTQVVVALRAQSPMGVLRTLDDVLDCLRAARPGSAGPKESR